MQINADQLAPHLNKKLAPIYLVSGDETLIAYECVDEIRNAAGAQGFAERIVSTVESGFDWDSWYASTQAMSLFAARRLLELRLPTGKPGDTGSKTLSELAQQPPQDVVIVVVAGKLERQARTAKWVSAIDAGGVVVTVYPVEAGQLPRWIDRRMRRKGLVPGPGVVEHLARYMEGNLLACSQEIDKLALRYANAEIGLDDIEGNLSDNARFNVFVLVDACLRGDLAAVGRIFDSLRAEGTAPVLILWALARELRGLAAMAASLASGALEAEVLAKHKVWSRRAPLIKQALGRADMGEWFSWIGVAAHVDRVIKGRASGDAWHELRRLALSMGGLNQRWTHK